MEMGSSSSSSNSPDSLNGLKFGRKIYFEDTGFSVQIKSGGGSSFSAAGGGGRTPAKKGRGVGHGGGPPRCQVEGCKVDLSDAKTYYSRHKLCVMHSKSPKVTVNGIEQRFCQQCSRFHQLAEFDQGKRSCRRRLAGHNERRRKPPPGSLFSSHYLRLSSSIFVKDRCSQTGSFLMDFKNPPPPDLFMQVSAGGTRYPGLGIPSGECSAKVSSDVVGVSLDSGRALSLLSNQPEGSKTLPFSLNAEGALIDRQTVPPGAAFSHFSSTPWSFKVSEASDGSRGMGLDLGPSQISQYYNGQYSGEFEVGPQNERKYMELQNSREYDSSAQLMNWSL